jgi:hypothetical protein
MARKRYYNPWGLGSYEFDKWLYNLAPAEGQNAYQAQEAYNAYAKSEAALQGGAQNNAELQNALQNMLSPTWQAERDNAQAAINEQAWQQQAQGGPTGRPEPPKSPLSIALDKISTLLYKDYYWDYYNSINRKINNNFIVIHLNSLGQWVRTIVEFNPLNAQTEYYIVTSKLYVNDWDGQKGSNLPMQQKVRKFTVTNVVFVYPFDANDITFTGPNLVTANNNTMSIVSLLKANPSLRILIQGSTNQQAMFNVGGVSSYSGGPFFNLVNDRATTLKTILTTAGVNSDNISLGIPIYGATTTATTINLIDTIGDSDQFTQLQLATFPNSGYVLPTKRP